MNISDISESRSFKYGFAAFLFLAVSLAFLRRIYDYDVWFHLAIGREVLANWRIPQNEVFVYTLLGTPGAYHAWGFEALLYFLYNHFGYWGMSCFQGVMAGLSALFLFLAASRGKALEGWATLFLAGWILLVEFRFVYRPEIILYLSLAVEIYLLEGFSSTGKWKYLVPVPALCMLLSWAHPSALLLLIVLFCYAGGFLWDQVKAGKIYRKTVWPLVLATSFSILFALINPYGIRQLLLPLILAGEKAFLQGVPELAPVMKTAYRNSFLLLLIVGLAPIIALRGGRRIAYGLLFLIFGFLTFKYARNLAVLAVIMYVPIVRSFQSLAEISPRLSRVASKKSFIALAALLLMASVFSITRGRWGAGPVEELFPVKSAGFMIEYRPKGKIFTQFYTGNFLEWKLYPSYLVSVDGRHYTHDRSLELYDQVFWMKEGWEKVLLDYDVGTIITPGINIVRGSLVPLVLELDADPSWSLAVIEPAAMLFMRTALLRSLDGAKALDKDLIWRQVIQESSRNLAIYPDSAESYLSLGIAHFKLHEFHDSLEPFKRYLKYFPNDSQALKAVTLIEAAGRGDLASGEELEALYWSGRRRAD